MDEERCGQQVEAGIHWILDKWNMGIFAEVLAINARNLKIHADFVEHVITWQNVKEQFSSFKQLLDVLFVTNTETADLNSHQKSNGKLSVELAEI